MRPEFTCCSGVCGNHGRCNTACLKETWECHPEGTYPCCQTGLLCYGWTKSGYGHCRHGGITKTLDIGSYYLIYIVTSDHGRLCWYLDRGNQGNNYQFSFRLDPRCNPNDLSFMWKVLPGGYPNTVIFENNQFQSNCVSAVFYDVTCYGEEEPERDREVVCSTHVDPNRLGPFLGGCDNKGGVDTPYNSWTISGPKIFNRQTGRYITGTASRSLTMEQLGVGGGIQDWVYYKIPWVKEIGPVGYKPGLG
ncbi:uncharacterized protein LOC118435858 [Folsomia candida]|nr:uncharacterized protein LOC118435858 [Folsomia candida]